MKVAVVHDWIMQYGGGERVVEEVLKIYPQADLFALMHFLEPEQDVFLNGRTVRTSFLQRMPFARKNHRTYLPLMPFAIEQFDFSSYDLVISSSSSVAKGVVTGAGQVHVSYIHTPMRYAWDLQHAYLDEAGIRWGMKGAMARGILHYMRMWDMRTATGVDRMLANSSHVARRVRKIYGREADIVHPPVDVGRFALAPKENFYLTASRMVPYKRIPLIVEAFSAMPNRRLVVVGEGPELAKVKSLAGANVEILGYQPNTVLADYMARAKAFIFAAEEDFGIAPVEAQAAGTPVIAYGRGGALETIRGHTSDECPTGLFFREQSPAAIVNAVETFEQTRDRFCPHQCRANAMRFSSKIFRDSLAAIVESEMAKVLY